MSGPINRRQQAFEMAEQMKESLEGIAEATIDVIVRQGINIIDGVPLGVRAGKMAEAMARANTARRVRDIDGCRRALREAAAYIMGALIEIGEPIVLPPGVTHDQYMASRQRFKDTPVGREWIARRLAEGRVFIPPYDGLTAPERVELDAVLDQANGPRLGDDDTGADIVAELQRLGVPPIDPSRRVVSIEDGDETPD